MKNTNQNTPSTEVSQITSMYLHPAVQKFLEEKFLTQTTTPPTPPSAPVQTNTNKKRTNSTVDPITNLADIQIAKDYFLNRAVRYNNNPNNIRDYALFVVGINCARRVSDMVKFTVSDFFNPDNSWKEHFSIKEQKTGKPIKIKINSAVKEAISMLLINLKNYLPDMYLFQSREGTNQPLKTRSVHRIMKEMAKVTGLDKKYNIGAHSLRKTWARQYYVKHPTEIVKIQRALNHSSPEVTLCYIGITQDEMDEMYDDNVL